MITREVRADRRRRDRFSAWFALACAVFYCTVAWIDKGFDWAYVLAPGFALCWLMAEYQREREATQ